MQDFPEIPDAESVHQLQTVLKACKTIQMEMTFTQDQVNCMERYFHMIYGIGKSYGNKQTNYHKRVLSIGKDNEILRTFESALEASNIIGVHKSAIGKAIRNGYKCQGLTLIWEQ